MWDIILFVVLLISGYLLTIWVWWGLILLPTFYGIPKTVYYVSKGRLEKSALAFYPKTIGIGMSIFIFTIFMLKLFPEFTEILLSNKGFVAGSGYAGFTSLYRILTTDGRKDLDEDFWDVMHSCGHVR